MEAKMLIWQLCATDEGGNKITGISHQEDPTSCTPFKSPAYRVTWSSSAEVLRFCSRSMRISPSVLSLWTFLWGRTDKNRAWMTQTGGQDTCTVRYWVRSWRERWHAGQSTWREADWSTIVPFVRFYFWRLFRSLLVSYSLVTRVMQSSFLKNRSARWRCDFLRKDTSDGCGNCLTELLVASIWKFYGVHF